MKFSLALLQLVSILSVFSCLNPISSQCLDNQKSSLLTLFSSAQNLTWIPNTDCCSWDGVMCDRFTGQVIGLDLSIRLISGRINFTSLISLSSLRTLNLSSSNLIGTLHLSLFQNFKHLSTLDFSDNDLLIDAMDITSSFPQVHTLNLRSCGLTKFPNFLKDQRKLVLLDLSNNKIGGEIPNWIWNIGNGFLTYLNISHNNITGQSPPGLYSSSLAFIDLHSNKLQGSIPFPPPSANIVNYSDNNFTSVIPRNISTNLEYFSLSGNKISGEIPPSICGARNMKMLDLSNNNLSGSIPHCLGQLGNLKGLILGKNNFTSVIPRNISTSLEFLSLPGNKINGEIPLSICGATSMQILDLSKNKLSGSIPHCLDQLDNLQVLNLRKNNFTSIIPRNISTNLEIFLLSGNKINGEIPPSICGSTYMKMLDLSNNNLSGSIPHCLVQLSSLHVLNHFTSVIPRNISTNLLFFFLSGNKISGEIPPSICGSRYLKVLDLSNNNLSGSTPYCLGQLDNLQVLNLGKNNFHGIIPQSFKQGCSLKTLNFNGNHLEGSLPLSLQNCRDLEVLNFGNNWINDTFPSWLGYLPQLQVLILRSNRFYGPIRRPESPNAFSRLQIIDISSNGFSGNLPLECFQNLKAMIVDEDEQRAKLQPQNRKFGIVKGMSSYYQERVTVTLKGLEMEFLKILTVFASMDLSNNRFQGNIPRGIGNLTTLYGLNMSHNEFTGPIPFSFGNLQQLESLDLSANELSGEIPTNLTSLTFLSVLNLSENHLVGRIPQGYQFNTFSSDSFRDNLGLCGPPLLIPCDGPAQKDPRDASLQSGNEFDWEFIYFMGLGFVVGYWMVMGPIMFWTKGRRCFYKHVDEMLAMAKEWLCQGL